MNTTIQNRKQDQYKKTVLPKLKEQFGYNNDLAAPRLTKIVINRGISAEDSKSGNILDEMTEDFRRISGQQPVIKKARNSIAAFKLREGMPNGMMVTLRGQNMWAFFDKLISIAAPRIRDFRGFNIKGDGRGNFTVGVSDQRIFVEAETRANRGFNITIVTSAKNNEEGYALLKELGFPFREKGK